MIQNHQNIQQLTNTIDQLKQNEQIYNYKLQQINQTRSKIQDQLLLLSKQYQKKIKDLQTKLQKSVTQNQKLYRQNQLFKRDIQGFQSRLIQKQKLISVLILQQNSVITHSQKSRSQNNDQNRNQFFNDQEKGFKKQQKSKILPPSLQTVYQPQKKFQKKTQKIEQPIDNKIIKTEPQQQVRNIQSIQSDNQQQKQPQIYSRKSAPIPPPNKISKTRNVPPPRTKKSVMVDKQESQIIPYQQKTVSRQQQQINLPKQNQDKEKNKNKMKYQENQFDKNDFFDNLNQNSPKNEEKQIGAEDFFNQLGNQEQNNPMNQIQESSIDYSDHSMISSSTTNMLETQNLTSPPPKKMKKKAKRQKITSVDPNAFD